jgi:hypothetical protein
LSGSYALRTQQRGGRDTDFSRWSSSLLTTYAIPERIALTSALGLTQIDGGRSSGDVLFSTQTRLSYWFSRTVVAVAVERGFSETFVDTEDSGVVQTTAITLSLSHGFSERLVAAGSVGYRENKTTEIQAATSERTEETVTARASLSLQLLPWLASSFEYAFTNATSTDRTREFTENRIRLVLTASF